MDCSSFVIGCKEMFDGALENYTGGNLLSATNLDDMKTLLDDQWVYQPDKKRTCEKIVDILKGELRAALNQSERENGTGCLEAKCNFNSDDPSNITGPTPPREYGDNLDDYLFSRFDFLKPDRCSNVGSTNDRDDFAAWANNLTNSSSINHSPGFSNAVPYWPDTTGENLGSPIEYASDDWAPPNDGPDTWVGADDANSEDDNSDTVSRRLSFGGGAKKSTKKRKKKKINKKKKKSSTKKKKMTKTHTKKKSRKMKKTKRKMKKTSTKKRKNNSTKRKNNSTKPRKTKK